MSPPLPRLFLIRHGETEWSKSGKHTGRTDIPLTDHGIETIRDVVPKVVGTGKLISPDTLGYVFVSPRQRAHKTFDLLFENIPEKPPHEVTEDVREWDYGDWEGLKPAEILERQPEWFIWTDGCPNGESPDEMAARVDKVIEKVRAIHRQYYIEGQGKRDVMIIAHGHFSRVFVARWARAPLPLGYHFKVQPAGISLLSYNHHLDLPVIAGLNLHAY